LAFVPSGAPRSGAEKTIAFMAAVGACPSALSRAPECGVHRSEAQTLAQEKRAEQAQDLARKAVEEIPLYEVDDRINRFLRIVIRTEC
jgi:hypothetical protein